MRFAHLGFLFRKGTQLRNNASRWEAFGVPAGRVWAVALTCSLACTQPGLVDGVAYADEALDNGVVAGAAQSEYENGDIVSVEGSNLVYQVIDKDKRTVSVGVKPGKPLSAYGDTTFSDGVWPADHKIIIEPTIKDANGTEWTVSKIEACAFRVRSSNPDNYINDFTINANLESIEEKAFNAANLYEISVKFNGKVGEIKGSALSGLKNTFVQFPEGSLVDSSKNFITVQSGVEVVYPLSSYNSVNLQYGEKILVKSPYATLTSYTTLLNGKGGTAFLWPDSNMAKSYAENYEKAKAGTKPVKVFASAMAIFSDSYTPDAAKPSADTETYSHVNNVKYDVHDGSVFAVAPNFTIDCTGDSGGNYGWTLQEGTDFTAVYYDADGNKLNEKPTATGSYAVEFVGNNKTSWGQSQRFSYTINPNLTGAVVSHGDADTEFYYDGEAHAPEIDVTINGSKLAYGDNYSISYVGDNGYTGAEAPTQAGNYVAYVTSKTPSTGGTLGQVAFSIKAHQLEGGALSVANLEVDPDGKTVTPEIKVTGADGEDVPAAAYAVSYKDAEGNTIDAANLTAVGEYTAVVTAAEGATGKLEAKFAIVAADSSIVSAEQDGTLTYSGEAQTPQFKVTDKAGKLVDAKNYKVTYIDADGNAVADLVNAGTYKATITATGAQYAGSATCDVVIGAQDDISQVQVTLNRTAYDYQSTPEWVEEQYTKVDSSTRIAYKSKAVDVDATVKVDDKVLQEGVDYVIKSTGDRVSSLEDKQSHAATFVVELMGNYSGTKTSDEFKYVVNKRIEHTVWYKGVSFSYAVNNDGQTAVITGLGVDLDANSTQADIAKAYNTAEFNADEGVFIPGTIETEDGKTLQVVTVADRAFSVPGYAKSTATPDSRDIWNGAKKLTIEKGIKEIGYGAMGLGVRFCNVEELSLPEGLEVIHTSAFGNSKVKKLEIPASVTAIGSGAFGEHNGSGNPYLEEFTFAKGSKFTDNSEGYWGTTGIGTEDSPMVQKWYPGGLYQGQEILGGYADMGWNGDDYKHVQTPMKEITIPASYASPYMLLAKFGKCTDFYFMGDGFPADSRLLMLDEAHWNEDITEYRLWGWDVKDTGLLNVLTDKQNSRLTFCPFAVLGNSDTDTFTYAEAWNSETQAADGTAEYAANTLVGTPAATVNGDEVTVDWGITTQFVNDKYSWTPQEGTDFAVKYQKVGSDQQVDKITEAGDYVATLTGNGKTCFGTATANVHVDAATLAGAKVAVNADSLVYNGKEQTPDVKVTLGEGEGESAREVVLQPGTDYTVEYVNAVDATDDQTKAVARVTGCGLYEGTVDGTFAIAKAPLTVTVANAAKTFGDDDPAFALSGVEGLVGDDSVVTATFTREIGEVAGAYAIKCTGIDIKDKSGKRLVTDNYQVTYKDGTLAISGQAAVDISGNASEVASIADQVLYGAEVRPSVAVKVGDKQLVEGADYVVSYKGNNAVGKATATITGIGAYTGTKTVEFNVVKFVQFPDVQDSDWFCDSVISAVRAGYMNGYANGLFGPNDTLTRGQAACVLANMAGADGTVAYDGQYADIDGSEYYAANTAWAKKIGVMTGYAGTDLFGPADNLTREQMACALYNYARDVDGKDVSVADAAATIAKFSDGDFVSGYATEPVAWAIEHGIMGNGGFINAQGDITRAEMAAMAVNYMTTVHED